MTKKQFENRLLVWRTAHQTVIKSIRCYYHDILEVDIVEFTSYDNRRQSFSLEEFLETVELNLNRVLKEFSTEVQ